MKRAAVAAAVLACLQLEGAAQTGRPTRENFGSPAERAAAQMAILAVEDSRLALPDDLHTPGIDTLRAKQTEDLRLLVEFARSKDVLTQLRAIRALGRLERRELIPDLLRYLTPPTTDETARAVAQAFRGPALPGDSEGQLLDRTVEALILGGPIPADPELMPGSIGPVSLALGRLPYERADQVKTAEAYMLRMMRAADTDPKLRPAVLSIARGMEILARTQSRLAALSSDSIDQLRRIVQNRRHDYDGGTRQEAMMALIAARGVDEETLRLTARSSTAGQPRLAAVVLGGAGAPVTPTERMELLTELLRHSSSIVRVEAVRAWARQESRVTGCQRLLEALKDPSAPVALAAIDALGDVCRDDLNVTDRLTSEAKAPETNEWHRASHALVSLAKRAPGRAFIALLGGHVQHQIWQVRMYAARAAAIANEVTSLERLAYDEEDNVREATLAPLRRLKGDEAEPYFVAALKRDDYQLLRTAAIELKGATPTSPLATALLDALRRVTAERKETSRDTRLALLERLQELGSPDQAGAIVPLLRDFDIPVAQVAGVVIQQWTGRPQEIDPQLLARPALPADVGSSTEPARVKMRSGKIFFINLRPTEAPLTVARFVRLARDGYYNGLSFHRVVANFVIQGGSPGANEYSGDTLYMRDEISTLPHSAGAVGLSTRGRDTGDAQFFINLVENPRLDFEYTVFGFVQNPLDVEGILEGDVISTITFEKEDKSDRKDPAPSASLAQCYAEGAFGEPNDNGCVVPLRPVHRRRQLVPPAARC
ncbi:MAG TPA: peptidylprolyl isomerase [Vicinamibacterales bacterium]|nr:peptidylprolyl isomerase [Vicinamibacterales bacterium]